MQIRYFSPEDQLKNLQGLQKPILLHPAIEKPFLKEYGHTFSVLPNEDLVQSFLLWKKSIRKQICEVLPHHTFLDAIGRKDLLADQLLQLFLDIGFDPGILETQDQVENVQKILQSIEPIKSLKIQDCILVGFSYDFDFLCFFKQVFSTQNCALWLHDHGGYPFWLDQKAPKPQTYFLMNQQGYKNMFEVVDFIKNMVDAEQAIAFVVQNNNARTWLYQQLTNEPIAWVSDSFESLQKGNNLLRIGKLEDLCHFSFQALYVIEPWFEVDFKSSLWTFLQAKKDKVLLGNQLMRHWFSIVKSENLFVIHPSNKQFLSLLDHPLEVSDPLPIFDHPMTHSAFFSSRFEKHEKMKFSKHWQDGEVHFPVVEVKTMNPTALVQLSKCPRQFFYQQILKAPKKPSPKKTFEQPRMDFGIMIHKLLQNVFDTLNSQNIAHVFLKEKNAILQEYKTLLSPQYQMLWEKEMDFYFSQLYPYVESQIQSQWKTFAVEYAWKDNALFGKDILWKGQIDRVDQLGESFRLIDYKTGNVQKKKTDWFEGGLFIQMPLYLYYFTKKYPNIEHACEIHKITSTGIEIIAPMTSSLLKDHEEEFKEIVESLLAIIDSKTFLPKPGPQNIHCTQCNFTELCGPYLDEILESKENPS